jgi:Tol biopolymer transport system component
MKCPHCEKEHADGLLFCPFTGKAIEPRLLCPQCGQVAQAHWQHCGFCGAELSVEHKMSAAKPTIVDRRLPGAWNALLPKNWRMGLLGVGGLLLVVVAYFALRGIVGLGRNGIGEETGLQGSEADPTQPAMNSLIVFGSDRDGNYEIYTMQANGSEQVRLTNTVYYDGSPAFSPDGQKIAFNTDRDANYEIYVMNRDGTNPVNLTNSKAQDYYPDWSPDMKKILYQSNWDDNWDIYVMNADGSGQTRLTTDPMEEGTPRYSPDGTKIAFTGTVDGNMEVFVMNVDGSERVRLTDNPATDAAPAWSPNGKMLVFNSNRDGNWEIYRVNADGSGLKRLSKNTANFGAPDWSPDGEKIIFTADPYGSWDIFAMDPNGENIVAILGSAANDGFPRWSVGSSKLANEAYPVDVDSYAKGTSTMEAVTVVKTEPAMEAATQYPATPIPATGIVKAGGGSIEGEVFRSSPREPIANATVILIRKELQGTFQEKIYAVTYTDNDGRYVFENVAPAGYDLWVGLEKIAEFENYPFCSESVPDDWVVYMTGYAEIPISLLAPGMVLEFSGESLRKDIDISEIKCK